MNVVRGAARPTVQRAADIQQEAYDRVLRAGAGRPVEVVKATLRQEIRTALSSELTDPALSDIPTLAGGGRPLTARL